MDETREGWDNFELNWAQYKEDSDLKGADVSRHLVECCSEELQSIKAGIWVASSLRQRRWSCSSTWNSWPRSSRTQLCTCRSSWILNSLIRFKLMSGIGDSEIKEDILGTDDKSLEDTVKAIEAK